MKPPTGWKVAVEIHPANWSFLSEKTWIAGWISPDAGQAITDVRAWLGPKSFLGLHGLPRAGESRPPYSGFSFLLSPMRGASLLRLEARDLTGRWTEFFRTPITVARDAAIPATSIRLAEMLPAIIPTLLRSAARSPDRPLVEFAVETLAEVLAEPLNSLPNPPFAGALEEPRLTGRVKDGRLSITGWITHRTAKISRLTAIIDPLREVVLPHGLARSDVAENSPEVPDHANAAFVGQVELPVGFNRPVLLKIFAELDSGEKHLAFAQRFVPEKPANSITTSPVVAGLPFIQAIWALRRAARRHRVSTEGIVRAGWSAWKNYPVKSGRLPASIPPVNKNERPLRILVATHNLNFEGAPRLVLELSAYLVRQSGISISVVSPIDGPLRSLFETAGMPVTVLDLGPMLGATTAAEFHARLGSLSQQFDDTAIDLVLANTLVSFWAVHLAHLLRKPAVLYVHESAPVPRLFAPLVHPALFSVVEEAVTVAQRVVFTADASRQIFAPLDQRQRFRVLPSWLDVTAIRSFLTHHDKTTLRAKHGFAADAILLLNLGTVCERKGQHIFIQAAELLEPELRATYPDQKIEFVLVGARGDAFLDSLKAKVAHAQLQTVRFVPETRENYDFHRLADILVCTSFEESSPRVLLEAATFGTPIVSTDVNGIPELLTGREAWLVEPRDHYQLAEALRNALKAHFANDTRRAKNAQTSVAKRFDERISLPRHLALVREATALSVKESS
ncbi:MAG TPA: glycosyltransferase family 4 protein [Lacunisphaera sp.]|jgi:glycosyltransferase involved in cell wall biosynthesis